jgi:hypothetical protein
MRVDEAGPSRSLIKNATKPIKIRARAQSGGLDPEHHLTGSNFKSRAEHPGGPILR